MVKIILLVFSFYKNVLPSVKLLVGVYFERPEFERADFF